MAKNKVFEPCFGRLRFHGRVLLSFSDGFGHHASRRSFYNLLLEGEDGTREEMFEGSIENCRS